MTTKRIPEADRSKEETAAALAQAKEKVLAAAAEGAIIWHDAYEEVPKGNQYASGGWVVSPATLELFSLTQTRLDNLGMKVGLTETQVARVRACRIGGTKEIYIVPTESTDSTGLEVNRSANGVTINLYKLLMPAKLGVRSGYKERYDIVEVDNGPVGPALKMDMSNRLERRRVKSLSRKRSTAKAAKTKPAETKPESSAEASPATEVKTQA